MQFLWENDSATKFKEILRSPDLQMLIQDYREEDTPMKMSTPRLER